MIHGTRSRTKVPGAGDPRPCRTAPGITDAESVALRNERVLVTTGLARVEGEIAVYIWASDNSRAC